jgi:hypothetical protein
MMHAVSTVAEMAAIGCDVLRFLDMRLHQRRLLASFGLPQASFTDMMQAGPHLLAPTGASPRLLRRGACALLLTRGTGSDLARYKEAGTVFAGFHYGAPRGALALRQATSARVVSCSVRPLQT